MRWSKPIAGLVWIGILAVLVGSLWTLALGALGFGDVAVPFGRQPAVATVGLLVVLLVGAVAAGARARGGPNPYW